MKAIPTLVLGGTGYVAGELLRLIAGHPQLELAGVMSESRAGRLVRDTFPQLQNAFADQVFVTRGAALDLLSAERMALFSAAPHGASAALVAEFIARADEAGCELTVVDVSADFRYSDAGSYANVYGQPHGAPELLDRFASALPEHLAETDRPHIGHPGCFSTSLLLAAVPLLQLGLTEGTLYATGVTGSTGSGRTPTAGTHHPERQSNLYAYKPLAHRHAPEVELLCEAQTGTRPALRFIPHSGPFARGIHLTMQAPLAAKMSAADARAAFARFYAGQPFVLITDAMPRIKDIVGSNYAHIGITTDTDTIAVFVVIDNLVKGAAGGAMQWMNRKLGLDETTGLIAPALAWT